MFTMPLPYQKINGFIRQEMINEADNNYYANGLLQRIRDCVVSHSSGKLTMPRTKSDNQEMNGTIKEEIIDTSDNHNNIIRLLPRRTSCESENIEVTRFYSEENYEIDTIGECVFEGFACGLSNSKEFIDRINSDLL